jgi:hypothetical protein
MRRVAASLAGWRDRARENQIADREIAMLVTPLAGIRAALRPAGVLVFETRDLARRAWGEDRLYAVRVTAESPRASSAGSWPKRIAWGAFALFLAAFAVFESQKYGLPTTAAALVFFVLPDLARLTGIRPPGALHQAVNRVWLPLAVLVGYTFGPIVWPPLFTAGLGWLTRIALDRARGRGLVLADKLD